METIERSAEISLLTPHILRINNPPRMEIRNLYSECWVLEVACTYLPLLVPKIFNRIVFRHIRLGRFPASIK